MFKSAKIEIMNSAFTSRNGELRKIMKWRIKKNFRRNRSTTLEILIICRIIGRLCTKNLETTLLFVDFSKVFDSIHRGKLN